MDGAVDNGLLAPQVVAARDSLTASQVRLAVEAGVRHSSLLDVGSGTGKFLHHARNRFADVTGIEVSGDSVRFAREKLNLRIVPGVSDAAGPFDVVTAWHSLEHIPAESLLDLVAGLRERCHADTRVVVCVPNPDSMAARLFGGRWAFRDPEAHLHEFSRRSLDVLFARHGFEPDSVQRLWAYTFFAWVQTLCNAMHGPHNYLYYRLKRGRKYFESPLIQTLADCLAAVTLCVAVPVGSVCAAIEYALLSQTSAHVVTYALRSQPAVAGQRSPVSDRESRE
jgi:SAM-dependent methyltransferase